MSQRAEIRAALLAQLLVVPGIPATNRITTENVINPGIVKDTWIDGTLGFGDKQLLTLPARGGLVKKVGTWRLRLHCALDQDTAIADTLAQAIEDAFPTGLNLISGATIVNCDGSKSWAGAPGIREGFYTVPIDIRWHVFSTNTLT